MKIKQSRFLKLLRQVTKQSYITIFGIFIDFRDWYTIWLDKGDDQFDEYFEGWSESWWTYYEIEDYLKETPELIYKKLPVFLTMVKWRSLWERSEKFIVGVCIGVLITNILGYLIFGN